MSIGYYILDDERQPVAVDDFMDFHRWREAEAAKQGQESPRATLQVARDVLLDQTTVSTVFLGLDHGWGDGPPVLFETMVFGGKLDECQWRWVSWAEAEAGHDRILAAVKSGAEPDDVE